MVRGVSMREQRRGCERRRRRLGWGGLRSEYRLGPILGSP